MGVDIAVYRCRIGSFSQKVLHQGKAHSRFRSAATLLLKCCTRGRIVVALFCLAQLVVCGGDVETNPGPDKVDQVLDALKEANLARDKFQKEMSAKNKDIHTGISDIKKRLTKVETALGEFGSNTTAIPDVTESVRTIKNELSTFSSKNGTQANLVQLVDDMNNRMRCKNLIFKGLPEKERKSYEVSESLIVDFCKNHLGVEISDIERAHRVGHRREGYNRPLIVKFLSYKTKSQVLDNAFRLKNLKSS